VGKRARSGGLSEQIVLGGRHERSCNAKTRSTGFRGAPSPQWEVPCLPLDLTQVSGGALTSVDGRGGQEGKAGMEERTIYGGCGLASRSLVAYQRAV
jgi:hypothetical protein